MKNFIKILALVFLSALYRVEAQQVVKKDTINGTELSVTMDAKVNGIINDMEKNCLKTTENPENSNYGTSSKSTTPKIPTVNRPLSNAEICRQNPKILGYKIQLNVVKSNDEANQVKAFFRNRFPTIKAMTDASLRPNYKVLAGSYLSKESAAADLKKIRQYFKSAIAIQYSVFCVEAK